MITIRDNRACGLLHLATVHISRQTLTFIRGRESPSARRGFGRRLEELFALNVASFAHLLSLRGRYSMANGRYSSVSGSMYAKVS